MRIRLLHGDCVLLMRQMPEASIRWIVTDPPYGLEFMGKDWDRLDTLPANWQAGGGFSKPGIGQRDTPWPSFSSLSQFGTANPTCSVCGGRLRGRKKCSCEQPHDHWKAIGKRRKLPQDTPDDTLGGGMVEHLRRMQQWHEVWLREAFRVLAPGGTIKAFTAPRTGHRLAAAMEAAGFEILDPELWCYGSGFPKHGSIDKVIDKMLGAERPVVGVAWADRYPNGPGGNGFHGGVGRDPDGTRNTPQMLTAPATAEAAAWEGWSVALKPAQEPFLIGRKPTPA